MDYVDWCRLVLQKTIELTLQSTQARAIGVSDQELGQAFFGPFALQGAFWNSLEREGLHDAIRDLSALGMVEDYHDRFWKSTAAGREWASDPVPVYEILCNADLEAKQEELLRTVNRMSPASCENYVRVADLDGESLVRALSWASDISLLKTVLQELINANYVGGHLYLGTDPATVRDVHSTLRGLVWETRRKFTQESVEIDRLVAEWETTSIEFKSDVHLDTRDEEAEFAKDILGLANTQASGPRRLVIGFDDKTHEYRGPPNPKLTQNWIERVLINDTEPMVEVRYSLKEYRLGAVGLIDVLRDHTKLPYKVKRSIGDKTTRKRIAEGQLFVRHGSQTEEPTPAELQALVGEGKRARGEPIVTAE